MKINTESADVASCIQSIANEKGTLGQYKVAMEMTEKALKIREQLLGENHRDTSDSYRRYSWLLEEVGQYEEALKYAHKTLEIRKKLFPENHPFISAVYSALGHTYSSLGKF